MDIYREPALVTDYHREYLRLLSQYANLKRQTVFIRYYNISFDDSSYDPVLESTYDRLGIRFTLYEFTPAFSLTPVMNMSSYAPDLRGQVMEGSTSLVIYTIPRPRLGDVVAFYDPLREGEYFRVTNLKTSVYGLQTDPVAAWFELDLEYAPIKRLEDLTVTSRLVYDLAEERYLPFAVFQERVQAVDRAQEICRDLTAFYDPAADLYRAGPLLPVAPNVFLWLFKTTFQQGFRRLFEMLPAPFGYRDLAASLWPWERMDEVDLEGPQTILTPAGPQVVLPDAHPELARLLSLCRELREKGRILWT